MNQKPYLALFLSLLILAIGASASLTTATVNAPNAANLYLNPTVGTYTIDFNLLDQNFLSAGAKDMNVTIKLTKSTGDINRTIAADLNADVYCGGGSPDYTTTKNCTYSWSTVPTGAADGNWYVDVNAVVFLTATPTDKNYFQDASDNNFVIDTAAPTLSAFVPSSYTPTGEATPMFTLTASDTNGVFNTCTSRFYINDATVAANDANTVPSGGTVSKRSPSLSFGQDVNALWICYDAAGNRKEGSGAKYQYNLGGSGGLPTAGGGGGQTIGYAKENEFCVVSSNCVAGLICGNQKCSMPSTTPASGNQVPAFTPSAPQAQRGILTSAGEALAIVNPLDSRSIWQGIVRFFTNLISGR